VSDIDYFTEKGPTVLAERVRGAWGVRSNLINGLPPAEAKVEAVAA
jgi:hypothetical protein